MYGVVLSGNGEIAVRLGAALTLGSALGLNRELHGQGILTGIGFLGAGVILRDPNGHVTGLTTAATIWICAVLGVACGLGYWSVLGIAVGLTVIALVFGKPVEHLAERFFKRKRSTPPDPSV
jgi:putative Mg2+ transporter-C (MgtC) family protein